MPRASIGDTCPTSDGCVSQNLKYSLPISKEKGPKTPNCPPFSKTEAQHSLSRVIYNTQIIWGIFQLISHKKEKQTIFYPMSLISSNLPLYHCRYNNTLWQIFLILMTIICLWNCLVKILHTNKSRCNLFPVITSRSGQPRQL